MNRREAMGALLGAAVSFVLPVPRPRIDLMRFCSRHDMPKYDMRLPWEHQDYTYATDGYACVRVRPESGDRRQHEGKMPPFGDLSWNHARLRGWRELPRLEPLLADQSDCPACGGTGFLGGAVGKDCPACDGLGRVWVGDGWNLSVPVKCQPCDGKGFVPPPGVPVCANCRGNAVGVFPSVVRLDDRYFAADQYERVRVIGCDFLHDNCDADPSYPMLRFRFEGGEGLLMGMDAAGVERRLVKGA